MAKFGNTKRKEIKYFDGVNSLAAANLAKPQELHHAENVRSVTVGTIEKRAGTRRLGDSIVSTANYKIFYFYNETTNGFYRISTVGGITSIYYLNDSAIWTALTGYGTYIYELGTSTTEFNISNVGGSTMRYTYSGTGTDPNTDMHLKVGTSVVIAAQNFNSANNGTFTVTGVGTTWFEVTNASGVTESGKTIGTGSIVMVGNKFSGTSAEDCFFLANGDRDNMYIEDDGTTVVSSEDSYETNHLFGSPKARKINYYKGKLYLADYVVTSGLLANTKRYRNGIMMSSVPLGIICLVNLDYSATEAVADAWIEVTDTKYIHTTDTVDIYRGNVKIADVTIKAKTQSKIQINTISFVGAYTTLEAADEVWMNGTYNATRYFRWAGNPDSGTDQKQYDTFTLAGGQNTRIKLLTNINDVMAIANDDNMAFWNDSNLRNLDIGVGCVSDNGYLKTNGVLWFVHYTGVYATTGNETPKLMSTPVQQYFDGATTTGLEASCIGKKGTSIFIAIGDVTLYNPDGSVDKTLSDVVLERNLRQETWYVHTGITATEFATYDKTIDVDRLEYASTDSNYPIMEMFNGETDDNSGAAREILFRADTSSIALSSEIEKVCYPLKIIVETERGTSMDCYVSLDGGEYYQLSGRVDKGCSTIPVTNRDSNDASPPRCRSISVSIRDYSKSICKIASIAIIYADTLEEEQYRK